MRFPRIPAQFLAVTALLAVSMAAVRPTEDEITGDLKLLQGKWSSSLADGTTATFEFKEKKVTTTIGDLIIESTITLDEKAEPNKTIDFKIESGPPDAVGLTALGIYKTADDGKKFTLCTGHPGIDRPGDFQDEEGVSMLFEMTKDAAARR
jgi:uncharacterized protein (TIGR03067 family)